MWALLISLALVLGLGCSLGGDAGQVPGDEALGAAHSPLVSPTDPLVCPPYAPPTIPGGLLDPTLAGSSVPGTIAGSFGVNDSGAATYAMALVVPPGRAGLAPDLTVVYDSDGENGPLGMGFRMTGLSAIRRCGHNFSDEGDLRAVNYDAGDRFCLDGRKLFADGTTTHQYLTNPDTLTRVRDQGDTGGLGPLSFTAYGADGRIYEYGATADARVPVANGAVATWALSKVSDRVGNFIKYEYESLDAPDGMKVQRLRHIYYTGHANLAPEREVEFVYHTRWDVLTRYSAGEAFRADTLLSNVRMFGPGHALVRDYAFAYELSPASQRSRLTSVQECAGDGPTRACTPATAFTWGGTPAGFAPAIEHGASFPSAPSPGLTRLVMVRTGDFNGDGTDDTAYLMNRHVPDGQPVPQVLFVKFNRGDPVADTPFVAYEFAADATRPLIADLTPLDYDADGRADLLVHRGAPADGSPTFRWLHATGAGFADVTGIGVPRSTPVGPYANVEGRPVATYFTDLNGDSHPDVVSCRRRRSVFGGTTAPETSYWTYQLHSHVGDGFVDDKPLSYGTLPGGGTGPLSSLDGLACATTDVLTIDLDGDGASEILFAERGSSIGFRALSVKGGVLTERSLAPPALADGARAIPLDVNGDGLRDLVVLRPNPTVADENVADVYLNRGDDLRLVKQFAGPEMQYVHFKWGYVVFDYDGDGREDLLLSTGTSGWRLLREEGAGGAAGLSVSEPPIPFSVPFDTPDLTMYRALDVDGDGDDDLVTYAMATGEAVHINARDERNQDRVVSIRDGLRSASDGEVGGLRAVTAKVAYDFLIDRSGWGGDPAVPPRYRHAPAVGNAGQLQRNFAGKKRVAVHTWSEGSVDAKLEHDFYYEDAHFHRLGAGWLGFARRKVVDRTRRLITEIAYDQTAFTLTIPGHPFGTYPPVQRFHFNGRPASLLTYTDPLWGGTSSSSNVSDVSYVSFQWSAPSVVVLDVRHAYRYQIADFRASAPHPEPIFGPFDPNAYPALSHETVDVTSLDALGNVMKVERDDGVVNETLERVYVNDTANWLVGLPLTIRRVSQPLGPGAPPAQSRSVKFAAYEPGTPLPRTIEAGTDADPTKKVIETRAYDAYGNLTKSDRVDPQGRHRQSCFVYEPEGIYPAIVSHAAGHETRLVYDRALGVPRAALDPNGLATKWSYDPFGRLARELSPEGADTGITRSRVVIDDPTTPADDPTRFTRVEVNASGALRRELWSAEGRLVHVESREFAGTFAADFVYDVAGRLTTASAPTLAGFAVPGHTTYAYDGLDRPRSVIAPDGLKTTYGYPGLNVTTTGQHATGGLAAAPTPPLQRATQIERDARGRITRSLDATQKATTYEYGAFDALRRVVDSAGNATVYTVDDLGNVRGVDDPDLGARTYAYNAFGQLDTATDAKGQTTTFVYDGLGRPTERLDADGTATWAYDEAPFGIGKLNRATAPGGVERTFTYDDRGRLDLSKLRASTGDDVLVLDHAYDDAHFGRLHKLSYPTPTGVATFRVRYDYDLYGHLETVTDDVAGAEIWRRLTPVASLADRQTLERFGNGVETARTFEPKNGLLTQLRTAKPGVGGADTIVQDLRYAYTVDRKLWRIDDPLQGAAARETFGYDALDRLTLDAVQGATGARRDATYGYDDLGNLTKKSDLGPGTLAYGTPSPEGLRRPHALTSFGSEVYDYDANGNQTKRPGATLAYNALDQLKTFTPTGQPATAFDHDTAGARVRKRVGSDETVTFDSLYERRRASQAGPSTHTYYVRAGGELVASFERTVTGTTAGATTARYVHPNHQGSTDLLTGPTGTVVQRRSYDPFGRARNPTWSSTTPPGAALLRRGFTEHEHDDELGLINMRGRMFDPRVGRFVQADPFVPRPLNGQSYNRYSYVRNSPPNFTDPSGYEECADPTCNNAEQGGSGGGPPSFDPNDPFFTAPEKIIYGPGGEPHEEPTGGPSVPFTMGGAASGWGVAGGETTTSGCRACDRGLDERKGQTWGGAESGGWQSPTDPGAQRSSESHSSQPSYAGDNAFNGGGIGGPGWPGGGASDESQVGQDLIGYAIQGLGCMLGCSTANAVAPGESGQSRVGYGEQALGVAAAAAGGKALGAIAGVLGRELGGGAEAALQGAVSTARGPAATLELAQQVSRAGGGPWRTVSLLETAQGPTLVGGGATVLSPAQKAFAEKVGLTVAHDLPGFHAEQTVLNTAATLGLTPTKGVATNLVCQGTCAPMIISLGGWVNGRQFGF